jgi:prophage DNA circulation protein
MAPITQTIQASFKGVPFNIDTETQDGGRKVAVHEYPGSDKRFVEDLGKKPGIFRVLGYISSKDNDDWLQQARRLTTVLEESTEGILELTIVGPIKAKAQTFSKTLKQTEIGRIDFNITFLISTPNPSPVKAPSSVQTVATTAVNLLDAAEVWLSDSLEVPTQETEARVSGYDGTQHMNVIAETIQNLGQEIDTVTSLTDNVRDNINDFVREPTAYAAALFNDGVLGEVFSTIEVSRISLKAASELTRLGYNLATDFESIEEEILTNIDQSFDIPAFADDTQYRLTNNRNRFAITNSLRIGLFAIYLRQAAANEYQTDSEINEVISDINDVYENILLIDGVTPTVALSVDACRIETMNVLETKIQNTPNVESLTLNTPTIDVELAYRLYAEEFVDVDGLTDKAIVLTELNDILPTRYIGEVEVLKL